MAINKVTRRQFVRDTAVVAAGTGVASFLTPTYTVRAGNPSAEDVSKILLTING